MENDTWLQNNDLALAELIKFLTPLSTTSVDIKSTLRSLTKHFSLFFLVLPFFLLFPALMQVLFYFMPRFPSFEALFDLYPTLT